MKRRGKYKTPQQIEKETQVQDERIAFLEKKLAEVKASDPFWFYEPSDGVVSDEGRSLLKKWLKPDDFPQVLEGQKHIHSSTAEIIGASGGNQLGKTVMACIETLIKVTKQLPIAMEGWYPKEKLPKKDTVHYRVIAQDYTNGILKNIIPTYQKWTPKEFLVDGTWEKSYSEKRNTLTLSKAGRVFGTIEFMSNEQDISSFHGPARDGLVFDEEPDFEVFKANMARLTTADRVDVLFSMTPDNGMSWIYDMIATQDRFEKSRIDWFKLSPVTNKRANLTVLETILKSQTSYDGVKLKLLGEFISLSGLVYGGLFNPRVHVVPPFPTGCDCGASKRGRNNHPATCPFSRFMGFVGLDPHQVKDSTMALCFVDKENNFFVDTCYKRPVDTGDLKSDWHKLTHGKRVVWTRIDPHSDSAITVFGGKNIYRLITTGENRIPRVFKADSYQGSIAAGIDTIKQRMRIHPISQRPNFYIFDRPENQELIKSFKTLQRDTWANEDVKGKKDKIAEGVHDHHACVRYVLQNKVNWRPFVEMEPVPILSDEEAILA
jgi:hypothetical protein